MIEKVNTTAFTQALGELTYRPGLPVLAPAEEPVLALLQLVTRQKATDKADLADAAEYAREQAAACSAHAAWFEQQAATYACIAAAVDDLIPALPPQRPPKEPRQKAANRPRRPKTPKA